MSRATTKVELLEDAKNAYEKLCICIMSMSEKERTTAFDFSLQESKKEAHWKRDKNLRDVYIHLYEWHQLVLNWITSNQKGDSTSFLPSPYNWKTYGNMNLEFWKKHQETSLEEATTLFTQSHKDVMNTIASFTNEELFLKNILPWAGNTTLGSYFISSTASHYVWALKKLKAHRKNCL